MTRISTVALACACVFASSSAAAYSEASAGLSGLTFTLIDLNPYDAITPSFTLVPLSGTTKLDTRVVDTDLTLEDTHTQVQPGGYAFSGTVESSLPGASAVATVDAASFDLSASGHASGPSAWYDAKALVSPGSFPWNISLSPQTALLITATVSLSATASNSPCSVPACEYDRETASAVGGLALSYSYANVETQLYYDVNRQLSVSAQARGYWYETTWVYNPSTQTYDPVQVLREPFDESNSLEQDVSVNFVNLTGEVKYAQFNAYATVSGYASAPVPEAGTVTMALTGLSLVSVMRWRRRALNAAAEARASWRPRA